MKTYVIAEVGPNHNGDIKIALEYIKVLSKIGCSAIKFQHGKPSRIFSNQSFFPKYQKRLSNNFAKPILAAKKRLFRNKRAPSFSTLLFTKTRCLQNLRLQCPLSLQK